MPCRYRMRSDVGPLAETGGLSCSLEREKRKRSATALCCLILIYTYDTRKFATTSDTVSSIDDYTTTPPKSTTVRIYQS
jgi:hypothetical protein